MSEPLVRFDERGPIERGFAEVFALEIAPELGALETERQRLWARANLQCVLWVLGGCGLGLLIYLVWSATIWAGVAAFFLGLKGLGDRRHVAENWHKNVLDGFMPEVCQHIGDLRYEHRVESCDVAVFQKLGIVRDHSEAKFSHRLYGRHRGERYEMLRAQLRYRAGDDMITAFEGMLMRVDVPKAAPSLVKILPKRWLTKRRRSKDGTDGTQPLARGKSGKPRFDSIYDIYAAPQISTATAVPLAVLDILVDLRGSRGGWPRSVTAAYEGATLYLAIDGGIPFVAEGTFHKPVETIKDELHKVFAEIALAHRIHDIFADG